MNEKIIVCCRWIPASWKSTWAKEQKGAIVLNKDTIREDLFPEGYVYNKKNEKRVVEHERTICQSFIKEKTPYIIIDNTHLGFENKHIAFYRELAKKYDYEFRIKDFYVSRKEAIERDEKRDKPVWISVINKMIKIQGNSGYPSNPRFAPITWMLPQAIIIDIDGTLAFMDDKRSPYDYSKVGGDRLNSELNWMVGQLQKANPHMKTIILSWRDGGCRDETLAWLESKAVVYDHLYMREAGDTRKDSIVKKELFYEHIKNVYDVRAVFDDRNQVVDMWRLELQLPTYQCWYGSF